MAVLGWDTPRELLVLLTWVRLKSEQPQGGSRSCCCPNQLLRLPATQEILVRNKNVKGALELTELVSFQFLFQAPLNIWLRAYSPKILFPENIIFDQCVPVATHWSKHIHRRKKLTPFYHYF